jgi:predicted nucleic acid-binding protein
MEERFLIDTNILIYYLDNKIPETEDEKISRIIENSFNISTITKIEILGWNKITEQIKNKVEIFVSGANVIYIDEIVEQKAIEIKQKTKINLPDAIIAATAIIYKMTIITRNENDFIKIKGLKIYNPFSKKN